MSRTLRPPFLLYLRDLRRAELFEFLLQKRQLFVFHVLDVDENVTRRGNGADELVELEVDGMRVAVLRILDEEDHDASISPSYAIVAS